jgi:ATP-dependent Clp protease ATP-binding subunit ClpA
VGLEHLLLSITEEPDRAPAASACGCGPAVARARVVTDVLERAFVPVPGSASVEPEPTVAFDRVVQHAVAHASASSATQVDTGSLLVFMLQETESHAAYFLKTHGVERLKLLRILSHGSPDGAAVPAGEPAAARRPPIRSRRTPPT